jgi:hypothetical protein
MAIMANRRDLPYALYGVVWRNAYILMRAM